MEEIARKFSRLMMQGKINPAIKWLLDQNNTGGILPLNDVGRCLLVGGSVVLQ